MDAFTEESLNKLPKQKLVAMHFKRLTPKKFGNLIFLKKFQKYLFLIF